MKSFFLLLLMFSVPVVVAQTIVDAPLIESTPISLLTPAQEIETVAPEASETFESSSAAAPCCDPIEHTPAGEIVSTTCSGCANCGCGTCCHVGGCGDEGPCGSHCQGMCCNNVKFDEAGNVVVTEGVPVLDGSATPVGGDSYGSSSLSVRGFGGGSGISAFNGGWGIGFGAIGGGGGGGGGRRAVSFAGFGARGFRGLPSLSASN